MTPDEVCEAYSSTSVGLSIRAIEDGDRGQSVMMLIEGSPDALNFLADVLRAVANGEGADTFALSPQGPGNFHFAASATHGVYVRRMTV